MRAALHLAVAMTLLASASPADIIWTGAVSNDIFDEANWDLSNSAVTAVDPNVSIDDNVWIVNAPSPVEIPDLPGQGRFQVGDGFVMTIDGSSVIELGNDGIGGAPATSVGPKLSVIGGGKLRSFFITNRVDLDLAVLSSATFDGGATPINGSTVNLTAGATLIFSDETVADYINEHLNKTTVDGAIAVVGGNLQVVSDGGAGCIVTVVPQFPALCLGENAQCPCGNNNNAANGPAGCANSVSMAGAKLEVGGSSSIAQSDLILIASGLTPARMGVFFQGQQTLAGGAGLPFGDGLRCAGGGVKRLQTVMADGSGSSTTSINLGFAGSASPGQVLRYQLWYGDNPPTPCGSGFNLTNAIEVSWLP